MMLSMVKRGAMCAGLGAAAGAVIGAGSAWVASRSTSDQDRKNLGMEAPSLVAVDELYEAVIQLRAIVSAVEVASQRNRGGGSSGGATPAQYYVALVKELDRLCALEQLKGNDEHYKPGMANQSLRYVQTVKSCLDAIETALRRNIPTRISEFQELRDIVEEQAGNQYHNLATQETISFERARAR
jgi:hypothetical protein